MDPVQALDLNILTWLRSWHNEAIVFLAAVVSGIAWKGWLWWLTGTSLWFTPRRALASQLLIALVLSSVLGLGVKGLIARPRPDLFAAQQLGIPMPELLSTVHSFPSGHTLLAAAFAFVVFSHCRDWRAYLSFVFVLLVGTARVYQGMHWPSDILGSIAMGAFFAVLAGKINQLPLVAQLSGRLKVAKSDTPPLKNSATVKAADKQKYLTRVK